MKNTIFLLIYLIAIISCSRSQKHAGNQYFKLKIKNLTNDSVKFWEAHTTGIYSIGLYFSSDGTCDEYFVDKDGNRQFNFYGDIIMDKPFTYKLNKDSLFVIVGGCALERCKYHKFKIMKLTQERLDVILKIAGDSVPYSYFVPQDQRTKPKFWYELYPNNKTKWPYGTY